MQFLKQSTAATVKIGPFVDATDGFTPETALTVSQADVKLSKNGGNIAQKGDATACTHDELGMYDCSLSTTDTGTLGRLQLVVYESGARPIYHEFAVLPANTFDSLISGTSFLQADVRAFEGNDAAGALTGHPTVLNVVHTGDDAVSGSTLHTVAELASTGTLVRVNPGVYDLGGASITLPAGVKMVGAGRGLTRIISTGVADGTPVITTGTRCELRGMTINGLEGNEGTGGGVAISWLAAAHVVVHGYNLEVIGQNDSMIYVPTSGTRGELYFENCRFESRNEGKSGSTDNIIIAATTGTAVAVFRNCEVYTDGGTQQEATGIKGGGNGNNYCYFQGGRIECVNTTNNATCYRIDSVSGTTEFYADGTAFRSRSTNGTALDINNLDAQGVLAVANCDYDTAKTSGTITTLGNGDRPNIFARLGAPDGASLAADIAAVGNVQAYDKDDVVEARTWTFTKNTSGARSPKIVTVHPDFDGTLAFDFTNQLNDGASVLTITSVTVSPAGQTITGPNGEANPLKTSDGKKVLFDVSGDRADDTDYIYTCTVTTTDSDDALVVTGLLKSRTT